MDGIRATIAGRKLLFATTGEVADVSGSQTPVIGSWGSKSAERDNQIRYTLDGAAQTPLSATYAFNKNNQLTVKLKADAGETKAFAFMGGIIVDDKHDFKYIVIDGKDAETGLELPLYGEIKFAETTNNMVIHLTGGGEAAVRGLSGVQSLDTIKNPFASFKADDLLRFHAATVNVVAGQDDPILRLAIIEFVGSWDLQGGSLVFMSKIKSSPSKNEIKLGFAGKIKAVTFGFVYLSDGNTNAVSLNIRGQHTFRSDKAATDFAWETSIGFSEKKFEAKVDVASHTVFAAGQTLDLQGNLTLKQDSGGPLALSLSLQAKYQFERGILVFRADISNGLRTSYDLMLEGNFQFKNMKLEFAFRLSNKAGAKQIQVQVGIEGSSDSMIRNLALLLDISESEASLKLTLSFEVRLRFVDGVRVKELSGQKAATA